MNATAPTPGQQLIRMDTINKVFYTDEVETHALSGIQLEVRKGEYVAIAGPSGSGKSTLLSIIGLLDSHPQPRDRFHFPELQPDRRPHGVRKRGAAAHLPWHVGGGA
jgi:ABC-type nitrate/sulfonate/bicarbonate transport system ATPase subunit